MIYQLMFYVLNPGVYACENCGKVYKTSSGKANIRRHALQEQKKRINIQKG